ncbi:hypothetical protein V3589_29310 [Sinorhizobium fredii]|uniref:hypothetical protein n=1 Tax=Rhizobium fredii TaxID=380 RepID=UPI0030951FF7
MPSSEPYLDVDLGPHNRIVKFSSAEEVQHFVEAEFETWSWLSAPPVQGDAGNPWPTVSKAFHQIRGAIQKVNNETSEPLVSALKRSLEQAFRSQRIPLSSSAVGAFIQDVRSESAITAAAALATWMGTGGVNYANFEQVKGAVLIAAFDADMTSRTPAAVKRSLRNLSQQFQNSREKTERETLEQRQTFSRERLEHRNALARALRRGRRDTKRFHDRNQSAINETVISFRKEALEATTSILETEALYREHMRLKGPVEYWSNKAKEHRINAQSRQRFLVVSA